MQTPRHRKTDGASSFYFAFPQERISPNPRKEQSQQRVPLTVRGVNSLKSWGKFGHSGTGVLLQQAGTPTRSQPMHPGAAGRSAQYSEQSRPLRPKAYKRPDAVTAEHRCVLS
eukprot:6480164-Amphidinium_carterae.1